MDKKLNYYKWGLSLVSIFSILLISLSVFTSGFRNWDVKNWFDKNNSLDLVKPNNDILSLDFNNSTHVTLIAGETVVSENSVSKTLTAVVYPEDAHNKAVDWSIDWQENDKRENENVSDYITITPSSDGSLEATVTAYKGFDGSSFSITVTTRDGNHQAFCTVSYDGAPTSIKYVYNGTEYEQNGKYNMFYLIANKTSTFDFKMSNTLNSVGSKYGQFALLDVDCKGNFILHGDRYENGEVVESQEFKIGDRSPDYHEGFWFHIPYETETGFIDLDYQSFFSLSISKTKFTIRPFWNETIFDMGTSGPKQNGWKYYTKPYIKDDGSVDDFYFVLRLIEKNTYRQLAVTFDILNSASGVSLSNDIIEF